MADRPQHILEIPDSLGRDVDRYREGSGPAPPMEAFMSDASLEGVAQATAAASAPVRAEDLVPITAAEASRRTTFDGERLPRLPRTARVLPAPFARQRIAVEHHGRAWTSCRADQVGPGDVVPGVGRVVQACTVTRYAEVAGVPGVAVGMKRILIGAGGVEQSFDPGERVRAFRLAELAVWKVADLGGGVGISADGYAQAGFAVTGFDINPKCAKYYPYEFRCADMTGLTVADLREFDLVHLGAPCQRWSVMTRCRPGLAQEYPDLITPMRPLLEEWGGPYVIENVEGAPLTEARTTWFCGLMFGKLLHRHRGFETGGGLRVPPLWHPPHAVKASKAGHWEPGTVMSIAGHVAPIEVARDLMGVTRRMPREFLVEAAPAYMTARVAAYAMTHLSQLAA